MEVTPSNAELAPATPQTEHRASPAKESTVTDRRLWLLHLMATATISTLALLKYPSKPWPVWYAYKAVLIATAGNSFDMVKYRPPFGRNIYKSPYHSDEDSVTLIFFWTQHKQSHWVSTAPDPLTKMMRKYQFLASFVSLTTVSIVWILLAIQRNGSLWELAASWTLLFRFRFWVRAVPALARMSLVDVLTACLTHLFVAGIAFVKYRGSITFEEELNGLWVLAPLCAKELWEKVVRIPRFVMTGR